MKVGPSPKPSKDLTRHIDSKEMYDAGRFFYLSPGEVFTMLEIKDGTVCWRGRVAPSLGMFAIHLSESKKNL